MKAPVVLGLCLLLALTYHLGQRSVVCQHRAILPATCPTRTDVEPQYDDRVASRAQDASADTLVINNVFPLLKHLGCRVPNAGVPPFFQHKGSFLPRQVVVDVGAFDGSDWTFPSLARGWIVYTFEPFPNSLNALMESAKQRNVVRDMTVIEVVPGKKLDTRIIDNVLQKLPDGRGHIFLIKAAASDRTGALNITLSGTPQLNSLTKQDWYPADAPGQVMMLPLVRIDDVVRSDVHIFKVDVQGVEAAVFKGAVQLFKHFTVDILNLEFWPKGMRQGGYDPVELLRFIRDLGFICYDWREVDAVPLTRPSDFKGWVDAFESRDVLPGADPFGLWDEVVCHNLRATSRIA